MASTESVHIIPTVQIRKPRPTFSDTPEVKQVTIWRRIRIRTIHAKGEATSNLTLVTPASLLPYDFGSILAARGQHGHEQKCTDLFHSPLLFLAATARQPEISNPCPLRPAEPYVYPTHVTISSDQK